VAVTTQHSVYRGILDTLETDLAALIDAAHIYISPVPIFSPTDDQFVQLVPGSMSPRHPKSGTGLVDEEFRVVVWSRLDVDQYGHSTSRITSSTLGVLKLVDTIHLSMLQEVAIGSEPDVVIPVTLVRVSQMVENAENVGWVMCEITYRTSYEIAWEVQ